MPPRIPKLNNKVRSPQGMNTGATRDLTIVPSRGGIGANFVDDVDTKLYVTSRHAPEETFVDLTNWNPQFGKQPFAQRINTAPLPNPYRFNEDNRDLLLPSVSQTGYLQAASAAPRPVTQVVEKLPFTADGEGYVGFKTYWDNVAGKTAPYPKHVIADPNYPATRKWIEDPLVTGGGFEGNTAFGVWKEHTQPVINGKLYRIGSTPINPDDYFVKPTPSTPEAIAYEQELLAHDWQWEKYDPRHDDYRDYLNSDQNYIKLKRKAATSPELQTLFDWHQGNEWQLLDRNRYVTALPKPDGYPIIPRLVKEYGTAPSELTALVAGLNKNPQTREMLTERQMLNDIDGTQKYGMSVGGQDMNSFDINMGSKRFYDTFPGIGRYIGRTDESLRKYDVSRSVNGVSDTRQLPYRGTVKSDYYSMAPQYARGQYEEVIVPQSNGLIERKLVYTPGNAPSTTEVNRLPTYPETPGGILPVTDPRVRVARIEDNAAYLDWKGEQQALIKQRPGSFNIVVDNDGNMARLEAEGVLPDAPDAPVAGVFHRDGTPFFPQPSAYNGKMSPTLPDGKKKELYVDIPGMGQIPNGERQRFPLTPSLARKVKLDPEGSAIAFAYDPSNPYTWDALTALNAKQETATKARIVANAVAISSNATDEQKLALEAIANQHETEYASGLANYQRALSYEPQSTAQKVSVTINNASDDAVNLLANYGLNVAGLSGTVVGTGIIPIDKHLELTGKLASQYNREELVLPPDVSIAAGTKPFKDKGIAENSLVKGVEWGVNDKGERVVVNPGEVIGTWEGQRIRQDLNAKEPTVTQLATSSDSSAKDPEWQQFLTQRDTALYQRRQALKTTEESRQNIRSLDAINTVRASNGLPLLDLTDVGQVSYQEMPSRITSWERPADPIPPQLQRPIQEEQPMFEFTGYGSYKAKNLQERLQQLKNTARRQAENKIIESGGEVASRGIERNFALGREQIRNSSYGINTTVDPQVVYTQHPLEFEQRLLPPTQEPVIRPAVVDLNSAPPSSPPPANKVRFVPTANGFESYVQKPGQEPRFHKRYATQQEYNTAVGKAQAAGWDVTQEQPYVDVTARPAHWFEEVPIDGPDTTWIPPSIPTPAPTPIPTPSPTPVIIQDPADNWNRYVPYAAAVGALGLGAGATYMMTRPSDEDKQQELQQRMAQYQMMQRMGHPMYR